MKAIMKGTGRKIKLADLGYISGQMEENTMVVLL
jgi:hypothetical protein